MRVFLMLMLLVFGSYATAHEMTPTYPKLRPAHVDDLVVTTIQMFNRRQDVEFYEVAVFDDDFNPIPFVTNYRIIKLPYLGHVTFDVYIRKQDKANARYICSRSKLRANDQSNTLVTSKICSKIKRD